MKQVKTHNIIYEDSAVAFVSIQHLTLDNQENSPAEKTQITSDMQLKHQIDPSMHNLQWTSKKLTNTS